MQTIPIKARRFLLPPTATLPETRRFRMCEANIVENGEPRIAHYQLGERSCYVYADQDGLDSYSALGELPYGMFLQHLLMASSVVSFQRHFFEARTDLVLYVDAFSGALEGIRMATFKFPRPEDPHPFELPEFMCDAVEATDDSRFEPFYLRKSPGEAARAWIAIKGRAFGAPVGGG